ncbi:hypothetical protein [Mesobacterium pallidum]|uniref:hypothetical protein n=1 Tax=Mesobacterium pallidum TaxID=2872037 RepID=UPI003AB99F77
MIRGVLLDIAGVFHDGDSAVSGSADAVRRLRDAGFPERFLTNATRRPERVILDKLRSFGIETTSDDLLTPASAARTWMETMAIPRISCCIRTWTRISPMTPGTDPSRGWSAMPGHTLPTTVETRPPAS